MARALLIPALLVCALAAARSAPTPPRQDPPGPAVLEAQACALCHDGSPHAQALRDASGRSVAPYDLWRSTAMAHAALDPIWRAVLSAEVAATPSQRDAIEAECLRCHTPLADRVGLDDHGTGRTAHALACEGRLGALARDGVSCTICHGMDPEGLGEAESFGAGFELDPQRRLFGPHARPFAGPMIAHTGFTPTQGEHVTRSALCGSCHTLATQAFDEQGNTVGEPFLEQATYLEWRNSDFTDEAAAAGPRAASCQDCHLPTTDANGEPIRTRLAHNPGGFDWPPLSPREPLGRHLLAGGNTLLLSLLRDHADELGSSAPREAVAATLAETRTQLAERSARVAIDAPRRRGGRLTFRVHVENLTGHKLPTGYPSRRAWLRVVVRDASGSAVFASGQCDAAGRVVGMDGTPLPSELAGGPTEDHRDTIDDPDRFAAFRAVMGDSDGRPTHTLLRAVSWHVDDRILPAGWSRDHPDAAATAPVGIGDDGDFAAGADRVHYDLAVPPEGPLAIEVALLYQPFSARWLAELAPVETGEVETLLGLLEGSDLAPEVLARASAAIDL